MYRPRHADQLTTIHIIKVELNNLLGHIALNNASLRMCSIPYIVLKNPHEAFKRVHASQIYRSTHLYLMHNVYNEMFHDIEECQRKYHLQIA